MIENITSSALNFQRKVLIYQNNTTTLGGDIFLHETSKGILEIG